MTWHLSASKCGNGTTFAARPGENRFRLSRQLAERFFINEHKVQRWFLLL